MGIESINSAMSFQAQPVVNTQTQVVRPVEKLPEQGSEGSEAQAPMVDNMTAAVADITDKDNESRNQQEGQKKENKPNNDTIKKAVDELNKKMQNSEVLYGIHEGTNRVTIKIVDRKTKDVIKELPPEKTLDMIQKVWEMAGLLVDEKR